MQQATTISAKQFKNHIQIEWKRNAFSELTCNMHFVNIPFGTLSSGFSQIWMVIVWVGGKRNYFMLVRNFRKQFSCFEFRKYATQQQWKCMNFCCATRNIVIQTKISAASIALQCGQQKFAIPIKTKS